MLPPEDCGRIISMAGIAIAICRFYVELCNITGSDEGNLLVLQKVPSKGS